MQKQSYIEKLLDGAEVEWIPLGKILVRTKGTKITAAQMKKLHKDFAPLKIFAGGKTVAFVEFQDIPTKDVRREPSIIVKSRGIIEFEFYDQPFSHKNEMWSYHSNDKYIDIKYVYHFLKLKESHFQGIGSKMQMPQIAITDTEKYKIPIPCPDDLERSLRIQEEVVRILDSFTTYTAELTAELTARQKQYNYYRERLFHFREGDVDWFTLDTLGNLVRGNGLPKIDFTEFGVPAIHYGQIYTYYGLSTESTISFVSPETAQKLRKVNKGDVILTNTSENIEDVGKALFYLGEMQAVTGGHATIFKPFDKILGKYFAYFTQTVAFEKAKRKYARGAKVIDVSANDMSKIEIPIPYSNDLKKSLVEQARIVAILDKFDTLNHSVIEGLPREIELRRRQYEFYRDYLLDFQN